MLGVALLQQHDAVAVLGAHCVKQVATAFGEGLRRVRGSCWGEGVNVRSLGQVMAVHGGR
jgi:hypothetical protein